MNICYLGNAASIHTQRWAVHFSKRGHHVTVVSLTGADIPGIDVRRIGPDPNLHGRIAYLLCLPRLRRTLQQLKPEIMHAHYAGGYGLAAALSGFHPYVVTAWGSDVLLIPRESALMKRVIRHSLRRADLVTSVASHMTARIEALGVERSRVITAPLGVDTDVFHPGRRLRRAACPLIVSTRHLQPVYNIELLVEALPGVFKEFPCAQVLIVGEGPEQPRLQARAMELGIAGQITFSGRRQPAEIAEYLSAADVYVSTSLSDGSSISLTEAMACGAFPVATNIPANRELIRHGENGFLTGAHDPAALATLLNRALADGDLRRAAAESNWVIIQQRGSWADSMEAMERQYRNLINKHGQPRSIRFAEGVH